MPGRKGAASAPGRSPGKGLPVRIERLPIAVSQQNQPIFLRPSVNLDLRNFGRRHGLYRLTVAGDVKPDNRQQNTGAAAQ